MTITFTTQFNSDLTVAREVFATLNLKGERPQALLAYLNADNDADRQDVIDGIGAGMLRRAMRQIAKRLDNQDRTAEAAAFWSLRDDVTDGEQFHVEYGDDTVEYDNAA
jgi:hypothetical protein